MKIATWNVNGIRARQDEVAAFVAREQPDVMCLQEIKAGADHIPKTVSDIPGYWGYFHGHKGYSGVALLIRKDVAPDRPLYVHPEFDHETRIAAATVDGVLIASIYVPNGGKDFAAKVRFLEAMAAYARQQRAIGTQLVLCGDLNVARAEIDVHPKQRDPRAIGQRADERALFEGILTAGGLRDVGRDREPDNDALFTWWAPWRNMRQRNIGWRLDYLLASDGLASRVQSCVAEREFGTSDHAPVTAVFGSILVSDFDGTLTIDDVTTLLWDRHLTYDWRGELLPPTYGGQWTPLQMIARGYGDIPVGPQQLLADARAHARLRPGLDALVSFCRARAWPFLVLSHGLTSYIQELLPPDVAVTAFVGEFADGRWSVKLPPDVEVPPGQDFKARVVADLRARHPGLPTVYLGDGRLDLPAAETCDQVFAVRGSKLAELCPRARLFDTLDEVVAALEVR